MDYTEYMSTKTAAVVWNITQRRVLALCAEGRIEGLGRFDNNIWMIPKNAPKPVDERFLRYETRQKASIKPFVKWAGGKGQLLEKIRANYPTDLGNTVTKYAEPFVGGGAVLFDILSNYQLEEIYISDSNPALINAYQVIRDDVKNLIDLLVIMQKEYQALDTEGQKEYYYNIRNRFNALKVSGNVQVNTEVAALFIILNRTCFNGLYRVNSKGQYNVPIGSYKNPQICDEENLRNISSALKNVTIVCGDYKESESFIDDRTFVYFDPPYRPLNVTSNFTSYTENDFDDEDQKNLAEYIAHLDTNGAKIIASNSDPKNVNTQDDFFDVLYSKFKIERVSASRMINSNAGARGKINELLIKNF